MADTEVDRIIGLEALERLEAQVDQRMCVAVWCCLLTLLGTSYLSWIIVTSRKQRSYSNKIVNLHNQVFCCRLN
jgi:hypothetical protein